MIESGKSNRTVESLRDRYKKFLRHLGKSDFDKIMAHLEEHGCSGFLYFDRTKKENDGILVKIDLMDPV